MQQSYDYVIVGAGSAGCVLAARLSENPANRVLLLEAGGWDHSPYIRIPLAWGRLFSRRYFDWMYDTQPEPNLNGRRVEFARGRVVGGSSSTNGMAYGRGCAADYRKWSEAGSGWSYEDLLPYFRRSEDWEDGATAYRGAGGPVTTVRAPMREPLVDAWFAAAAANGHSINKDYNAESVEGFSIPQSTIRRGLRCSAVDAYLRPALRRPNLTVVVRALALRILFEDRRAVGVEYSRAGHVQVARGAREVILAGGVVNSPQLLMLSGIGPVDELARHGIGVIADLPGVGTNLQDHLTVGLEFDRKGTGEFLKQLRYDRFALAVAEALTKGTGIATSLPMGCVAWLRSEASETECDLQLLFRATARTPMQYRPGRRPQQDGFGCRVLLMKPESRGMIRLASADPAASPLIFQNFLSAERDWRAVRAGLRLCRTLTAHPSVAEFVERETSPGEEAVSDAALDMHIRATAATAHHPVGTCRMAGDGDALGVVDARLRVRGVTALRVVDASIMPEIVSGPPNAVVYAVAEKASDMIGADAAAG